MHQNLNFPNSKVKVDIVIKAAYTFIFTFRFLLRSLVVIRMRSVSETPSVCKISEICGLNWLSYAAGDLTHVDPRPDMLTLYIILFFMNFMICLIHTRSCESNMLWHTVDTILIMIVYRRGCNCIAGSCIMSSSIAISSILVVNNIIVK